MESQTTKLGVGVVITRNGKVLLAKRKNAHGDGTFAGPGGNLNYMETPKAGILREITEECGTSLKITDPKFLCVVNWTEYAPIHYIGVGFTAEWLEGNAEVMEADKFGSWDWYAIDELPEPIFGIMRHYLDAYLDGETYIES